MNMTWKRLLISLQDLKGKYVITTRRTLSISARISGITFRDNFLMFYTYWKSCQLLNYLKSYGLTLIVWGTYGARNRRRILFWKLLTCNSQNFLGNAAATPICIRQRFIMKVSCIFLFIVNWSVLARNQKIRAIRVKNKDSYLIHCRGIYQLKPRPG